MKHLAITAIVLLLGIHAEARQYRLSYEPSGQIIAFHLGEIIQPESHAVYVGDREGGVFGKVFPQLGDEHVHAPADKVAVVAPDHIGHKLALKHLALVLTEQAQQLGFLLCELALLAVGVAQFEIGIIEGVLSELILRPCLLRLSPEPRRAFEYGPDAEHQLFRTEGLGDVVVGAETQSLDLVFRLIARGEEYDRHFTVGFPDILCETEAVLLRHHHIEQAQVVLLLVELHQSFLSVLAQVHAESLLAQHVLDHESEVHVVFHQQDARHIAVCLLHHHAF
jgi:hypothetical protein